MKNKPLSMGLKWFTGIGQLGSVLKTAMFLYLGTFFITDIAGLPVATYTLVSTLSVFVTMFLTPIMGGIMSKSKPGKLGKTRKWLLIWPLAGAIPFILVFTKYNSVAVATVVMFVAYILATATASCGTLAAMSMFPVVASDSAGRAFLSGRFALWQNISKLVYSLTSVALLAFLVKLASGVKSLAYTYMSIIFVLIWILTFFIEFKLTEGYDVTDADINAEIASGTSKQRPKAPSFKEMAKNIIKNPPLGLASIAVLAQQFIIVLTAAFAIYYYTYVAANLALYTVYLTVSALVSIVASWVSPMIAKKISSKSTMIAAFSLAIVCLIICKIFGVSAPIIFIVAQIVLQFAVVMLSALLPAAYSDCAVYAEWKTGVNTSASVMSIFSVVTSLSSILRSFAIALALSMSGYVPKAAATYQVKVGLVNGCVVIPLIFAALGLISIFFFPLTKEKMSVYEKEIAERRAENQN